MKVFYMCLYRFGYDFEIVATSLQKGYSELKKVYYEWYGKYNCGDTPSAEEWRQAKSDIEISEMILDKVRDI